MIKEAYCSFEVAKLLKEKGFNTSCMGRYSVRSKEFHLDGTKMCNNGGLFEYAAPTHQMAMAWLREIHNISIEPFVDYGSGEDHWWTVDIGKIKKNGLITELSGYKSYEESVEAALKYTLENLI